MQKEITDRERIWHVISLIPSGSVATYGQIAQLAELPGRARLVGRTLSQLPAGTRLPWFRVINASGRISLPQGSSSYKNQKHKLLDEGITIVKGRISLNQYQWRPGLPTTVKI
ncbi:MAG: MGMT family protein [Pseudomonadales bacterium]|nr:MGMT family protein [Pseudomonadales bacterium]